MQSLDLYILSLFVMHVFETSIFLTLLFKKALHKQTITKLFYSKVILFTAFILVLIYLSDQLVEFIPIKILQLWLQTISPLGILLIIYYIFGFFIIERKGYSDYFGDRSLVISLISVILIYLQVSIFSLDGYPTFIILLRIFFPLD